MFSVVEDSQNRLWGASGLSGLWRYSPEDDQWLQVKTEEMTKDPGATFGVVEDADGGLWWADSQYGLWYWEPGDDGFKRFFPTGNAPWATTQGTISRMYVDSRNHALDHHAKWCAPPEHPHRRF